MTDHNDHDGTPAAHGTTGQTEAAGPSLDRRSLLRRGGALVAGVAGASVVGAALAGGASAATGDPTLLGTANDAGTATTSVTSGNTTSTLSVASSGAGAPLVVVPQADNTGFLDAPPGGFATVADSGPFVTATFADPYFVHDNDVNGVLLARINTDLNTETVVGIAPVRVLDTRSAAGRANIIVGAENLDSAGRLKAGKSIAIQLSSAFSYASVVFGNLTVAGGSVAGGFATVWPEGATVPATSTINFARGGVIANAFTVGAGFEDTDAVRNAPTLRVFTAQTTHLVLDIVGAQTLLVLVSAAPAAAGRAALSARHAARDNALGRALRNR